MNAFRHRGFVAGLIGTCLVAVCLGFSGCVLCGDAGWREYKVLCGIYGL